MKYVIMCEKKQQTYSSFINMFHVSTLPSRLRGEEEEGDEKEDRELFDRSRIKEKGEKNKTGGKRREEGGGGVKQVDGATA